MGSKALGSKQAPVLVLGSKQVLVLEQARGNKQVLELVLGSKPALEQVLALGSKLVLGQVRELGSKRVLEQEQGSKPVLVVGSKALQACSIVLYACSSRQKGLLVLELLKIQSKRSSPKARKICSSRSPKCLSSKKRICIRRMDGNLLGKIGDVN